jgi:hypothetical protein
MTEVKTWPPPKNWISVKISWKWMLNHHTHYPNEIQQWILDTPGGRFHLSGYDAGEGFDYRFEDPKDAIWFRLNLPR